MTFDKALAAIIYWLWGVMWRQGIVCLGMLKNELVGSGAIMPVNVILSLPRHTLLVLCI